MPPRITELEGETLVLRQSLQEPFEACGVRPYARRQLKQDRAQLVPKNRDPLQE
jgi:hypothetical protein